MQDIHPLQRIIGAFPVPGYGVAADSMDELVRVLETDVWAKERIFSPELGKILSCAER